MPTHFTRKKFDVLMRRFTIRHIWKLAQTGFIVSATVGFLIGNATNTSSDNRSRIEKLEGQLAGNSDYINSTFRYFSEIRADALSKGEKEKAERLERLMKAAEKLTQTEEQGNE